MNKSTTFLLLLLLCSAFNISNATAFNIIPANDETTKASDDLTPSFHIEGKAICIAENFAIPVTASEFDLVTSFQFTISWDNSLMHFDTISYRLPELGSTLLTNELEDEGVLTVSWYDVNVEGLTIDDFTALFHINFTAIAGNQTNINVTFENQPTPKEVSAYVDNSIEIVEANYNGGAVNIDEPTLENYELVNDVDNANVGAVFITVENGKLPYQYIWSTDVETQNLENVGVGDYSVTVIDAKDCATAFEGFTIENTVNVQEINSLQSIQLYPNPAQNQLYLTASFDKAEALEIAIFNILGEQVVIEKRTTDQLKISLDISKLNQGNYFLRLKTADGLHSEKLEIIR